jgi:hypothetical protein
VKAGEVGLTSGRRAAAWVGVAVLCACTAWPALRGEDEVRADAIWAAAGELGAGPADRVWIDAAAVNVHVAPWQEAWPRAQRRVAEVAAARRALLAHDRGGRRHP